MKEIWLYAMFGGTEFARIYISQVSGTDDEIRQQLDVYEANGCYRQEKLASILPYGCTLHYRVSEAMIA
jgi:hypothetical protein